MIITKKFTIEGKNKGISAKNPLAKTNAHYEGQIFSLSILQELLLHHHTSSDVSRLAVEGYRTYLTQKRIDSSKADFASSRIAETSLASNSSFAAGELPLMAEVVI